MKQNHTSSTLPEWMTHVFAAPANLSITMGNNKQHWNANPWDSPSLTTSSNHLVAAYLTEMFWSYQNIRGANAHGAILLGLAPNNVEFANTSTCQPRGLPIREIKWRQDWPRTAGWKEQSSDEQGSGSTYGFVTPSKNKHQANPRPYHQYNLYVTCRLTPGKTDHVQAKWGMPQPQQGPLLCVATPHRSNNTPTSRLCLNPNESTCQLAATAADLLRYESPPRRKQTLPQQPMLGPRWPPSGRSSNYHHSMLRMEAMQDLDQSMIAILHHYDAVTTHRRTTTSRAIYGRRKLAS